VPDDGPDAGSAFSPQKSDIIFAIKVPVRFSSPTTKIYNENMKRPKNVKIVVTVPVSHAEAVREAMGRAGAGRLGNYSFCSFSSRGEGRFKPERGAHPAIGTVGRLETVEEERIEAICDRAVLNEVVAAIRKAHPYEEPALDVYPLEDP